MELSVGSSLRSRAATVLVLGLLLSRLAMVSAAEKPITSADFSKDGAGWVFYGHKTIDNAEAKLAVGDVGKYHGGLVMLTSPLRIPQDAVQGLHIRLKVAGFTDISGGANTVCSGRFFLAPNPMPSFIEPYSLSDAFVLMYSYAGATQPCTVSVFSKVHGKDGYGDLLYQGTFDSSEFPMTVDIALTKETYRLSFDKPVTASTGGKSGYHKLPSDGWGGDLTFGGRIVNEDDQHDSQILLDTMSAGTTSRD